MRVSECEWVCVNVYFRISLFRSASHTLFLFICQTMFGHLCRIVVDDRNRWNKAPAAATIQMANDDIHNNTACILSCCYLLWILSFANICRLIRLHHKTHTHTHTFIDCRDAKLRVAYFWGMSATVAICWWVTQRMFFLGQLLRLCHSGVF